MEKTKHIDWIDLAKGICILLVVYLHCKSDYYIRTNIGGLNSFDKFGYYFRMPLYFFLSGLFFKDYPFLVFLKKKTNKLIIPFVTFAILSLFLKFLYNRITGLQWEDPLYPFITIWFLIALFVSNISFLLINRVFNNIAVKSFLCFIIGVMACYIPNNPYNQYLYAITALVSLPYFCIGYVARNTTSFLSREGKFIDLIFSIVCLAILFVISMQFESSPVYINNEYHLPLVFVYSGAFLGVIGILLLSRYIKTIPGIVYLGRHSIIVLITHYFYLQIPPWHIRFEMCNIFGEYIHYVIFLIIIILEFPTIWFCKKYLPYIFAQKDLIK